MKNFRFLTFVLTIATLILSACGAAASTAATPAPITTSGSDKVDAMPVAFVGIVDSIAGDQWVISGTTVTVAESIVRDGPFHVGDRIKVEGFANPDGSFTVSRVEAPTPQDILTATPVVADNSNEAISNANTNDANVNDDNSNSANSNDANVNDDHGNDVNSNDDNSNSASSIDDNSNTANSNDANVNDDHGGNSNSSIDNSNSANSNDDNGGSNSNDDKGGSNSNDDNGGGGGNSNDDNGNGG